MIHLQNLGNLFLTTLFRLKKIRRKGHSQNLCDRRFAQSHQCYSPSRAKFANFSLDYSGKNFRRLIIDLLESFYSEDTSGREDDRNLEFANC